MNKYHINHNCESSVQTETPRESRKLYNYITSSRVWQAKLIQSSLSLSVNCTRKFRVHVRDVYTQR